MSKITPSVVIDTIEEYLQNAEYTLQDNAASCLSDNSIRVARVVTVGDKQFGLVCFDLNKQTDTLESLDKES